MMTASPRSVLLPALLLGISTAVEAAGPSPAKASQELQGKVLAVLRSRCVKCHGPAKPKAGLTLTSLSGIARGGENGPVVLPGDLEESVLWLNISEEMMPPDRPLPQAERAVIRRWIEAGAPGLAKLPDGAPEGSDHWAFQVLARPGAPAVRQAGRVRTEIDRFLQAALEDEGLSLGPDADRSTLIRRVSFDLTGLPPTPEEIAQFREDPSPDASERMVDRFLASPHYGERWGKHWLDAAGYADSNGYFHADTDRPLAYRYRDYVVRSFNADKPLDRFVREQLAGDEISAYRPGQATSPGVIDLIEATHYLRNGQDGTDDSQPDNPEAQRIDRYAALEAVVQITANSLLGLTIQCARCHDHKFEPITQEEYYQLQAIFYPAFNPNPEDWIKPKDRFVFAYLPGEKEEWEARTKRIDAEVASLREEFRRWIAKERPRGIVRFEDRLDPAGSPLAPRWSGTAPGDDSPGGQIEVDSAHAPGAINKDGAFRVVAGQGAEAWISTKQAFDWTPDRKGDWIQATFDLVDNKLDEAGSSAERIGYSIAAVDFNDSCSVNGGNILIDGNPCGTTSVHLDYPGQDSKALGSIGKEGYAPGHNYGVRVTKIGGNAFRLEHLVDWSVEGKSVVLKGDDLPDGGFAFFASPGRSYIVDDVLIEGKDPARDRPKGLLQFEDDFDAPDAKLTEVWSTTAPGDDKPGGAGVQVDAEAPPGALRRDGRLQIAVGEAAEGWLSTAKAIDWTPDLPGHSVQVTFDLVDNRLDEKGASAERIGYYLAMHDFDDSGTVEGGNILVDGNPGGPTSLFLDDPGKDRREVGAIGKIGYVPGRNYGVRVTNAGKGMFRLEHLVDGCPEDGGLILSDHDLPDGGFGFHYGSGRGFVVDNVVIESDPPASGRKAEESSFAVNLRAKSGALEQAVKEKQSGRAEGPGRKIAWATDRSATPPKVPLLTRGNYASPGPAVQPTGLAVLTDPGREMVIKAPESGVPTTGRRLALARWLTEPGSRPAALLARVQANRIWQGDFGVGLAATSDNLGQSGAAPSHPELLDFLASELVGSGWSVKSLHRLILRSTAYRQSSHNRAEAFGVDPDNRLLWRYPLRRLDAEAIRDAMLAVSGDLDARQGGPYVPTQQSAVGEVVVEESTRGARRRSIYLQQRRSQTLSMLKVFDAPSIAFICSARSPSTIPLQSLNQLNSEFALARARGMARRVEAEAGADRGDRIRHAFLLAAGREPTEEERAAAERFLEEYPNRSPASTGTASQPLTDFCQMLLASNVFLYIE